MKQPRNLKAGVKGALILLLNALAGVISLFVPKSRKIWLFGSWFGSRFADNTKYLFEYCMENRERLGIRQVVWVTHNQEIYNYLRAQGCKCFKINSLPGIYYHLRAKYHVVDEGMQDLNAWFSVRAVRVNLWHGFGIKKIGSYRTDPDMVGTKALIDRQRRSRFFSRGLWGYPYLLAMSDRSSVCFQNCFSVAEDRIIRGVYPRNVYRSELVHPWGLKEEQVYIDQIRTLKEQGKKIVAYFPTFRDDPKRNQQCADVPLHLQDVLKRSNACLVTKMHFASGGYVQRRNELENVINLPSIMDIYSLLDQVDLLITDYSSILVDFMIFDKPELFYPFDLDSFTITEREFIYDYDDFCPGKQAFTPDELGRDLQSILQDPVSYFARYAKQYDRNKRLAMDRVDCFEGSLEELVRKIQAL